MRQRLKERRSRHCAQARLVPSGGEEGAAEEDASVRDNRKQRHERLRLLQEMRLPFLHRRGLHLVLRLALRRLRRVRAKAWSC